MSRKLLIVHYHPISGQGQFIVIKRANRERWYPYSERNSKRLIIATLGYPTHYHADRTVTLIKH